MIDPNRRPLLKKYRAGKDSGDDVWYNGSQFTYNPDMQRYYDSSNNAVQFVQGGVLPEAVVTPSTRQRLDHPLLFNQLNAARMTPEQKEIYYKAKQGLGSEKLAEFMGELTPVGDATDAYRIGDDLRNGNLGAAAAGVGLFFLPNFIEKPVRKLGKLKRVFSGKKMFQQEWNDALNYAKSKEREQVFKEMLDDAKQRGFISGEVNDFLLPIRESYPTVEIKDMAWMPLIYGDYLESLHRVRLLSQKARGGIDKFRGTAYHEALHSVGVGDSSLSFLKSPEYNRISEEVGAINRRIDAGYKPSLEEYNKLSALYDQLYAIRKEYRGLNEFVQDKTDRVLRDSYEGDYLRNPAELVVNGLEFGKNHGVAPHTPYPGEDALDKFVVDNANDIADSWLYNIKLKGGVSDKFGKDFWDIITGNFLPAAVPLGFVGASRIGGKDEK